MGGRGSTLNQEKAAMRTAEEQAPKRRFRVIKLSDKSDKEADYGTMVEEDMQLVTKGYKPSAEYPNIYIRKGSSTYYLVEEEIR